MESSIEVCQTGDTSNPKPVLAPKPRLTPKPFSLQKNTSIRSINAPKTAGVTAKTTTQQNEKSKATRVPKPTVTAPTQKPAQQTTTSDSKPSPVSVLTKDLPKETRERKASPHGEDTLDSGVGKSDPVTRTSPPKETPKSEPIQRGDVTQANHKASTDVVNSAQIDRKKKEGETLTSAVQHLTEPGSDVSSADNPASRWGGSRKRLSMELTSRFESAGLSLPPQPTVTVSTASDIADAKEPESSAPEPSRTASEPPNTESDDGAPKEEHSGGGSIKRRISLLFDSSSRPEPMTKRDEPEIVNGTGVVKGVKERIKIWATETTPEGPKAEKQPPAALRNRSKTFEPAAPPTAEKTSNMPPIEPPKAGTLSSRAVDRSSMASPADRPTETPMETSKDAPTEVESSESSRVRHMQDECTEGDVQLRNRSSSETHNATGERDAAAGESSQGAPKRDNVKRRSVRFGVVERDDGGPPLILGSATDSSEEEASEDEAEGEIPISVPIYSRAGGLQKKVDDEEQEKKEEQLKHLELERRRRAEEHKQALLNLEEERKRKEGEEREKERARQKEEEERARQRLKEEEKKRERLKEEEMMREREEERERAKQKEERLKQDQKEREKERLKEVEREDERLREGILKQKLRDEEINEEKQREDEWEKEWLNKTQRLRGEEEKRTDLMWQRQKEEDRERARQKEERLRQEEREEERLRDAKKREREKLREGEDGLIENHEGYRLEGKLRQKEINTKKQREEEWEKEWVKETESLREEEVEKEREKELELMWQRKTEEDKERVRQKEERLRQEERVEERLREVKERERESQRRLKEQQEKEEEMERMRGIETERLREDERREEEMKRQKRLKEQQEKEEEMERMRRIETERQREEERREQERMRQMRLKEQQEKEEMERMRQIESERQREEERREEERRLKERQEKEKEMERMRRIETERLREEERRAEERMRPRLKEQQEKEEEMERMRRIETERQREEERRAEERMRQMRLKEQQEKEEEMERMRRIETEQQREEEIREEERRRQTEKERVEELERRIQQQLNRKREQELKEKREREEQGSQAQVVYDDFSVRPARAVVDFDDFSVKPKRWGSQAKVGAGPLGHSWSDVSADREEVQAPLDVSPLENRAPEQVERPDSPEPTLARESPEEEEEEEEDEEEEEEEVQLISVEVEEEEGQKETQREEVEKEDEQETPVNSYGINSEDTDALIDNEPDKHNGAREQTSEMDSPKLVTDQAPEVSADIDTTGSLSDPEYALFPESSTKLLDTSAQKSKADLGKRRNRTRPARSLRGGLALMESSDWRICDSTDGMEASSKQRDTDSEEEQPKSKLVCSPPPTSKRVPMFPGLSNAALMAQITRKPSGVGTRGGDKATEDKRREERGSQKEEAAPSPSPLSRSPRSAAHLAGAARVLPPLASKDGGAVSSPAWLKELKSKKRLSQYDSET